MRLGKTYRGLKRIPLHTLICNPQQKQTRVRSVLCCHSNEKGSKAHKSLPAPSRHNPTESGYELLHNQLHEHTEGEEITCTLSSTTHKGQVRNFYIIHYPLHEHREGGGSPAPSKQKPPGSGYELLHNPLHEYNRKEEPPAPSHPQPTRVRLGTPTLPIARAQEGGESPAPSHPQPVCP
jgi:hypothetical protein